MPLDEKEPEKEPPKQDPLGFDFWVKHVFRIGGVVIGITLSGLFGFGSASRFAQHEEVRLARSALRVIRAELEGNVAAVASGKAALEVGDKPRIELRLDYLDAAAGKPFMASVDPALLGEIEALLGYPLPEVIEAMAKNPRNLEDRERQATIERLAKVVERSAAVLAALKTQEDALDAQLRKLRGEAP